MKEGKERFLTPVLNKNTVYRRKIIEQIGRLSKRGILFVHSPAGYGKTTAVALWARYRETAWIPLDEYSAEPAEWYRLFLSALSLEIPEEFAYSPLEYTLDALEKRFSAHTAELPEVVSLQAVVIDDFHLCTDPQAARALVLIRSRLPEHTAFIIISRNPPPDILAEYTVKGVIHQMSALQFTAAEIQFLFGKHNVQLTNHEAEMIHRRTDGWAGALAAILLSSGVVSDDLLNSDALNNYLKCHVFDSLDDYHILKKLSVCDILYPGLCAEITGQNNAFEIISRLADKTGLVRRVDRDTYSFHTLLKDFLSAELALDETIDRLELYKTAAKRLRKDGYIFRAIDMAARSRDVALLEEYFRGRTEEYGKFGADIEHYASAVIKYVLSEIPAPIIKRSLRLSVACYLALFALGRLQESFEWVDTAEELLWSGKHTQSDIIEAALSFYIDPRKNVLADEPLYEKITALFTAAQASQMPFFSLTFNFPFVHKDVTYPYALLDVYLASGTKYLGAFIGPVITPLAAITEAGLHYEGGDLQQAEKIAEGVVRLSGQFPPEIQFCALALYAEILRVKGKDFDYGQIRIAITRAKAHYLYANFSALAANARLHNGDIDAAGHWLAGSEVESSLRYYKIYQYFTTARALMVSGKLSAAQALLARLAVFLLDYRRPSDYIEALTLQSICLWHIKREADSMKVMTEAIYKAFELQIVMPIIKEGGDVQPVLSRLLNRLKYGYGADELDKSFVNTLLLGAESLSRRRGIMVKRNKNKPVKLSPRQREVLGYLEQGLSYKEISGKIGIKVSTVEDHIDKVYEKLEVRNAHDAVLKAREIGGSG